MNTSSPDQGGTDGRSGSDSGPSQELIPRGAGDMAD